MVGSSATFSSFRRHQITGSILSDSIGTKETVDTGNLCYAKKKASTDHKDRYLPKDRLVIEYLPLAKSISRRYRETLGEKDAYQIACLGLVHAAGKFHSDRGAFPSYATIWIRSYFQQALIGCLPVHLPASVAKGLPGAESATESSQGLSEMIETYRTVALDTTQDGTEDDETESIHSKERVEPTGLSSSELHEILQDESTNPEAITAWEESKNRLFSALQELPDDQSAVLAQLYGLHGLTPLSQTECAPLFAVSRNTIIDRQARGLQSLRQRLVPFGKADLLP